MLPGSCRCPRLLPVIWMDLVAAVLNNSYVDPSEARKYVVYKEVEAEPVCDSSGAISTFTFLNFIAASISMAGILGSNSNSNNNNNNNNNNDNNNNDNNINIGNNNNNANSGNTIMFIPMMGRRSSLGDHPYSTTIAEICYRHAAGHSSLSLVALSSIHVFHHLISCKSSNTCDQLRICSIISSAFLWIPSNKNLQRLQDHLIRGALRVSLGMKLDDLSCTIIKELHLKE